jgi:hypothetical protein
MTLIVSGPGHAWGSEMRKRQRRFLYLSDRDARGRSVSVSERPNSGGRVRVKWTDAEGTDNYVPLRGVIVRDEAGELKPDVVEQMRGLVAAGVRARTENRDVERAIWTRMAELGLMHDEEIVPRQGLAAGVAKPVASGDRRGATVTEARNLTLGAAFDRYFSLEDGEYATDSRQRKDELGMKRDLFLALPADTPIAHIGTADFKNIWKTFARLHFKGTMREVKVGRPPSAPSETLGAPKIDRRGSHRIPWGGLRHAERTIDMLRKLLAWAVEDGELLTAPAMPRQWKKRLKSDWEKIARKHGRRLPVVRPGQHDHAIEEVSDFLALLGEADPRLEFVIECFIVSRLGQALRAKWSDLHLNVGPHGAISLEDRGQKWGPLVWLTRAQRRVVDRALVTYLAPYERARRAQLITDYPLCPSGRLNSRKATLRMSHLSESGLRAMFNRAEKAAGVDHVRGRGWYGLKRLALNELEDLTKQDYRIHGLLSGGDTDGKETLADGLQNALSGHGSRSTRALYQRFDRPAVWRMAILVMEKLRQRLGRKRIPMKAAI